MILNLHFPLTNRKYSLVTYIKLFKLITNPTVSQIIQMM